ncbi:hypothetical protein PN36_35050 [Candidatus Thiomargarita nelsonii]|uniref:Uncharacterized protein n=1 Tax=Candidatus Thiomargarita nelsonii TaxID=1003181 RepID=A0A4E0QLS8_9GAMM|nr:hypothetical protein PN36_35050 [Candidatus Thiomargarita nelsonii]
MKNICIFLICLVNPLKGNGSAIVIDTWDKSAECNSLRSALYVTRMDSSDQPKSFMPEANRKDGSPFNKFANQEAHGKKYPVSFKQEEVSLYAFPPAIQQVILDVVQSTLQSAIKQGEWDTFYFEHMAVVLVLKSDAKTKSVQGKPFTTGNVDAIHITLERLMDAISKKVVDMNDIITVLDFHTHVPMGVYELYSLKGYPEEMPGHHGNSRPDVDGSIQLYNELKKQNKFIKLQSYVIPFHLYYLDEYKSDEYKFVSRISIP